MIFHGFDTYTHSFLYLLCYRVKNIVNKAKFIYNKQGKYKMMIKYKEFERQTAQITHTIFLFIFSFSLYFLFFPFYLINKINSINII